MITTYDVKTSYFVSSMGVAANSLNGHPRRENNANGKEDCKNLD